MDGEQGLGLLNEVADAVAAVLGGLDDWGLAGTRAGQYRSDLAADEVAVRMLTDAGVSVLSEETGWHGDRNGSVVVIDPLDGSTNASRGVPWYATSLCLLDAAGPSAAVVLNLASRRRYTAIRGAGAWLDGREIHAGSCTDLSEAMVGLSGMPARYLGWKQFRALGAAALDLCAVASGVLDGYIDCSADAHGSWDYLGGLLVCTEAGAVVADLHGRELVALEHESRRTPIAASTPELLQALLDARRGAGD